MTIWSFLFIFQSISNFHIWTIHSHTHTCIYITRSFQVDSVTYLFKFQLDLWLLSSIWLVTQLDNKNWITTTFSSSAFLSGQVRNLKQVEILDFRRIKYSLVVNSNVTKPEKFVMSKMWTLTFCLSKGAHVITTSGQSALGSWR